MLYINKIIPCQLVLFSLKVLFLFGLFWHRRWDISSELKGKKKCAHFLNNVQKATELDVYILFCFVITGEIIYLLKMFNSKLLCIMATIK